MEDNSNSSSKDEIQPVGDKEAEAPEQPIPQPEGDADSGGHDGVGGDGGDGWGWGFSPLSVLSDIQKAASVAAEEISRSAAEVFDELQKDMENSKPSNEENSEASDNDKNRESEVVDDDEKKLENATEDTIFGQGFKNLDHSVENFASEAWRALGNAWREGSTFIHKLENSIQQGPPPSLVETGKALSAKGMQVLDYVSKETMDLIIDETDMKKDKNAKSGNEKEVDQIFEEVTFDRCFYIYGGPEQLEELEALSNHYSLLFNRRKAKLSPEKKSEYDDKFKQIQQIFSLDFVSDDNSAESEKGKKVENSADNINNEIKSFHDSSVNKAAEMAAGFANALAGLSLIDIVKRTGDRLDSLHSEGVHRLSEMCCIVVFQLLILGKSVISNTNKTQVADEDIVKIEWPEDSIEKAKIIRTKTLSMTSYLKDVSISFLTGISDVGEAYAAAIKGATANYPEDSPGKLIQEKTETFSENLRVNQKSAVSRIQDGLRYLAYLVVSTSMPAA